MGPIGCPETSVMKCHYSLHKNPQERSFHLLRGGSLKSRRHVTATPAYSSDETAQIRDLTPPLHSKTDISVLQKSAFGKITSFRRGKFTVGRKNQFPVRGRKNGGKWGQTRMKTNNEHTAQNAVTSQTWLPRPYRHSNAHSVHATLGMRV